MSDDDKVVAVIQAAEGLVKAVPIYQDAIQPAAIQVGKSLETVAKTINVALAPVSALVWGYEKISVFLNEKLTEKLKNIPPERITTPNLLIAGPVLESLKFAANEEKLSGYQDIYRIRIGNYRLVYKRSRQQIFLILIGHRKEIYRLLHELLG